MDASRVVVAISDPALAHVLVGWLREALGRNIVVEMGGGINTGDVVVVTPGDCDPVSAAELASTGAHVIVLTPMPRRDEMQRYGRAGAAYIAMSIDGSRALEDAILARLEGQSPVMAAPAALSHALLPKRSA